jgi:multicomponent Na+:H+ antiporter subunit A
VALTLLLVEVLTAVAAVLVLRALPPRFRRTRARRVVPTAALAAVAGGLAAAGTLAFTGHRERSGYGTYFLEQAGPQTGGGNVVNTILVDFRALDTLGEATVLGVAALGLVMLLRTTARVRGPGATPAVPRPPGAAPAGRTAPPILDRAVFQVTSWVLVPSMLLFSVYLFLRGHHAPGGGFISALVAGAAFALGWYGYGRTGGAVPALRALRPQPLVGAGMLICVTVGLAAGLAGEPFLTPLHADLLGLKLSSSLLFDLGVYLFVLGLVIAAVERLGTTWPPAGQPGGEPAVRAGGRS